MPDAAGNLPAGDFRLPGLSSAMLPFQAQMAEGAPEWPEAQTGR